MKQRIAVFVLSVAAVGWASPKPIKSLPKIEVASDDAIKQHARVRKLLPAATREKAESAGKAFATKSAEKMTVAAVIDAAQSEGKKLVASSDVGALVLLVLMEASNATHEDMQAMLAALQKVNAERKQLHELVDKLKAEALSAKKAAAPAYLKKITTAKTAHLQLSYPVLPTGVLAAECENKAKDLCLDELQQKDDALSDLSEETMARLQQAMDRDGKFRSAISNILKKVADTKDAVISNLKP